jgi:hypothetical protein
MASATLIAPPRPLAPSAHRDSRTSYGCPECHPTKQQEDSSAVNSTRAAREACCPGDWSGAARSRDGPCAELLELGLEAIDEGEVPVNPPEHDEAGAVVGELGAVLRFVQLPRRHERQLADFGDLVRGEDGEGGRVRVLDSVAQLAFAGLVVAERWIV